jgi:hypothetical protein
MNTEKIRVCMTVEMFLYSVLGIEIVRISDFSEYLSASSFRIEVGVCHLDMVHCPEHEQLSRRSACELDWFWTCFMTPFKLHELMR